MGQGLGRGSTRGSRTALKLANGLTYPVGLATLQALPRRDKRPSILAGWFEKRKRLVLLLTSVEDAVPVESRIMGGQGTNKRCHAPRRCAAHAVLWQYVCRVSPRGRGQSHLLQRYCVQADPKTAQQVSFLSHNPCRDPHHNLTLTRCHQVPAYSPCGSAASTVRMAW